MAGSGVAMPKLVRGRTVLLLGKSQVGKSHMCNALTGRPGVFQEGNKIASCTLCPKKETIEFCSDVEDIVYHISLIDMPGLFDTRTQEDNDTLMARIMDFIRYSMESLDRIFYVMKLGAVSPEEVKCLELVRSLFSQEALDSGIFSLVITHCDLMSAEERAGVKQAVQQQSNLQAYSPMFRGQDGAPCILAVDFSKNSTTAELDRQELYKAILSADSGMHKQRAFRFYATLAEAEERKKMRAAMVAQILAELKVDKDGQTVCPVQ